MNDEDRRSLQICRSFIVKNIENIEDITEELFSRDVFTESMKSDVEVTCSATDSEQKYSHDSNFSQSNLLMQSSEFKDRPFLSCHRNFHMKLTFFKGYLS